MVSYNFEQRLPLAGEKRILHPSADVLLFVKQANEVRSKLHYYQFNIGDYQSHTGHLSEIEDLAYRRMLDWIYLHEKPIPKEINEVARNIRMRTHCESIAIVLQEFFICTESGWVSDRVQREIAKAGDKSRKASESARARWDADALRTQSKGNATHNTLHITHKPIDTILVKTDGLDPMPSRIACPTDKLLALYHQECPTLPRVMMLNDKRKKHLVSRWREVDAEDHLETAEDGLKIFQDIFSKVHKSDFLCGRTAGRQWKSNFDWLIQPTNFLKVVEGQYDNRGKS